MTRRPGAGGREKKSGGKRKTERKTVKAGDSERALGARSQCEAAGGGGVVDATAGAGDQYSI